ncbi:MAG: hypothetical protein AB7O50_07775 [Pseudolabrys sp.]
MAATDVAPNLTDPVTGAQSICRWGVYLTPTWTWTLVPAVPLFGVTDTTLCAAAGLASARRPADTIAKTAMCRIARQNSAPTGARNANDDMPKPAILSLCSGAFDYASH